MISPASIIDNLKIEYETSDPARFADPRSRKLFHAFRIAADLFVIKGSDSHILSQQLPQLKEAIRIQLPALEKAIKGKFPGAKIFVAHLGDAVHDAEGKGVQQEVGEVTSTIASVTENTVIFVPGNHDLRGQLGFDVWNNFGSLPDNVVAPLKDPTGVIKISTDHGYFLAANLFYDFNYVNSALTGLGLEDLHRFYKKLPDGRFLLGGATELFPVMASNLAKEITPDVCAVFVHVPPHPFLTTIKVAELTEDIVKLGREAGVPILCKPDDDVRQAIRYGHTAAEAPIVRIVWNAKTGVSGSNIVAHELANPGDTTTWFSGHTHRNLRNVKLQILGKKHIFHSWQNPVFFPKMPDLYTPVIL